MRKEARISTSVWRTDFTDLPLACQGLYWMLLAQPDVSMCGVLPYLPGRWASMCGSEDIDRAMSLLEDAGKLVVDRGTSEVLIRTFVNHDGVLRGPKTRAGMWKSWGGVLSDRLRRVVLERVGEWVDEAIAEEWVDKREVDALLHAPDNPPEPPSHTPSDTPSEGGEEGASDGGSPRARASDLQPPPPPPTTDSGDGKPPRKRDLLFETLVEVCGLNLDELTRSARGRVNVAARDLREIGASPESVRERARVHRKRWPEAELTPTSLSANYAQLGSSGNGSSGLRVATCPKCDQAMASHDADICEVVQANG